MAKDITFDERIDTAYDRWKDGDVPSLQHLADTDCANCDHDWHEGRECAECPCKDFALR